MPGLKQIINYINNHPLAGRHRLKAYSRFLSWQIIQTIYPHETTYGFIENTKLVVKKGLTGATGNIYTGLHEFSDMAFLLHFLREEDLFFDVGANIGSYTVLASGFVGATTIAFEPVPSTFSWLNKNIKVNGIQKKTKAKNIALGSQMGELNFTETYDTINHVATPGEISNGKGIISVGVETFDSVVSVEGCPILTKIDVEGFETEVLKGMENSLESNQLKAVIIELNGSGQRYGYDELWVHELLLKNKFHAYVYEPFSRNLELVERAGPDNTIYIRDIEFVKKRIRMAKKVNVFSEYI